MHCFPLKCSIVLYINAFSLPYGFLNAIFFSLAYFTVRLQYIIPIAGGFLSVRLPVNRGLSVVKSWGCQSYTDITEGHVRDSKPRALQGSNIVFFSI